MKKNFLAKSFSHPSLTTVKYSSGYLLFILYSTICFWIDWICAYKYMKIKGFDSREVTSFPKSKNAMNMVRHFNHRQKKETCILITFGTKKVYNTDQLASPSKFFWSFEDSLFFYHWSIHLFQSNQYF